MLFKRFYLSILILSVPWQAWSATTTEDQYYSGNIDLYPKPVAVSTAKRDAKIERDEMSMAFRQFPEAISGVKNSSVSVRVTSVESVQDASYKLKVSSVWKNIHPKQKVDKKSLEGKADRTMGAGGLFFGSGKGGGGAGQTVEKDVAYKIPKWGDHLFLLADGIAYPVDAASASLPHGTDPAKSFSIARFGQQSEVHSLFTIPNKPKNTALQIFDYSNGNIQIPLSGDVALARGSGYPKGVESKAGIGNLDLGIAAVTREQKAYGIEAGRGWQHLVVKLAGKSNYRKGGKASIARIDAEKYIWLEGDGGFQFPVSWVENGTNIVRFTPEFFSSETIGFLVPNQQKNFLLAMRDGGNIIRLPLSHTRPTSPPRAAASFKDGDVAEWLLFSINKSADGLLVDMGVHSLDKKRGLEIDPFRQVAVTGKKGASPDRKMTRSLAFGAQSNIVVPPGGMVRFVLLFKGDQMPTVLHVRGMRGEGELKLNGVASGDLKGLSLARPEQAGRNLTTQKRQKVSENKVGALVRNEKSLPAASARRTGGSPAKEYRLPEWDMSSALQEQERGKEIDNAIDLSKALAVKGSIGGKDDREDYYYLDIQGEPHLWGIESAGASVAYLAYVDSSKHEQQRVTSDRKTGEARLLNMLLAPGRHWIKVSGSTRSSGAYQLRVIDMGKMASDREYEPNDDKTRANRLLVDESVSGLMDGGDKDRFRFSLNATEHLQLTLQTANTMQGRLELFGSTKLAEVRAKSAGETIIYEGVFPPGDYRVLVRPDGSQPSPGSYRLSLSRMDPFAEPGKTGGSLPVLFEAEAGGSEVAAYWPQAQQLRKSIRITNQGLSPLSLTLKVWTSHNRWHATPGVERVALEAGRSRQVDIDIRIEPDAISDRHVAVVVAAMDQHGAIKSHRFGLQSICGVEAVKPQPYFAPPELLLGGINVAWSALGAKPVTNDPRSIRRIEGLFDSMAYGGGGLRKTGLKPGEEYSVDINLAGKSAVPVLGFALNPMSNCDSGEWLRDFEIELSKDGSSFEKSLHGSLKQLPGEQYFELSKPFMASHARLRLLNSQSDRERTRCLGEWKVIADPAAVLRSEGVNIADPRLGGHIVWRSFSANDNTVAQMLAGEGRAGSTKMFADQPNDWVIGFRDDRMASIAWLEWKFDSKKSKNKRRLSKIRLSASRTGPVGPWEVIGEWQLDSQKEVSRFTLKKPIWARFIRLSAEVEKTDYFELPAQLRIIEQATGSHYRSIVGEWGNYSDTGPYERKKKTGANAKAKPNGDNGSRERAVPVRYGQLYRGNAVLGDHSAWYRLKIPKESNTLEWSLTGDPVLTVRPRLMTLDGKSIAIRSSKKSSQNIQYAAEVRGGGSYLLQIEEPPRSIVFAWDNSGSVSSYLPSIYQMLNEFSGQIKPGREYVNLLPFQDKKPPVMLLENWSDQPLHIMQALNDYPRKDGSSNAELNLTQAVKELEDRDGNRAVIIITDAESGQKSGKSELWEPINRIHPRIFSLELHSGNPSSQDKMQDWSFVNSGHYSYFRNQTDLDAGFERAVCLLRRPSNFDLVASTNYRKPPGPGAIRVTMDRTADQTAMEIILDASGSMYKKLGSESRIGVAKSVLKELMQKSIPEGTPLALRIYGHRKARACDTKLEIPLRSFKPKVGIGIVDKVDPKDRSKTPLAQSLALVTQDMKSVTGKSVVILLTDGEESCGGDPEEAIRSLREQGMDVRVNIVGLAIDSDKANKQFTNWAKLGGGSYFEAKDREGLKDALNKALFPKFLLLDRDGEIAAEGVADGSVVSVPSGRYQLKVLTAPVRSLGKVVISEGKTEEVRVKK